MKRTSAAVVFVLHLPLVRGTRRQVQLIGCLAGVALAGCAIQPIPGGKLIRRNYQPQVLVAYVAGGDVDPGVRHYLVRDGAGLAFFEQAHDGSGTLFERHWTDAWGDHFAVWESPWMGPGQAVELVVPLDRNQPAWRFVYDAGLYDVRDDNGLPRPVPKMLIEASAMLNPTGGPQQAPPSLPIPAPRP